MARLGRLLVASRYVNGSATRVVHQHDTPRRGEDGDASCQVTGAVGGSACVGGSARAGNTLTLPEDAAMGDTGGMDDD
ncbi:hypothetical protein FHR55_002283 [Xanthomonas arboricola]